MFVDNCSRGVFQGRLRFINTRSRLEPDQGDEGTGNWSYREYTRVHRSFRHKESGINRVWTRYHGRDNVLAETDPNNLKCYKPSSVDGKQLAITGSVLPLGSCNSLK